jgi:large subunit ribosomal protein L18
MTRGKVRIIPHRRRRQGRTDYRQRLGLLKSGRPRFVVRKTLNSMSCQVVRHSPQGDKALVTVTSKRLEKFGWKSGGNLPGAYLTGLLCGTMAIKDGIKSAVLDMGPHASTRGSRIYGALKGALDAGLDIPHSPDVLPPIERIRGLHIEQYSQSKGKKSGISKAFDDAKARISSGKPAAKPEKPKEKKPGARKPAAKKPAKKPSAEKAKKAKPKKK